MANLIIKTTGNFTSSTTWGEVASAGEINSEAGTVAISTGNIDSPTFTPGAAALDGVALKLSARASSPSGTFTVTLRNSTAGTDAQSVTVNVSDLNSSGLGWVFFKFGSSHTPNGTDSYIVRCVCSSSGSQVTLYRSTSGTNNFSKKLRLTSEAAPASGNHLVICGERTGAGTGNNFTVTLDNTANTSFGPTVSGGPPEGIMVSQGGTFTCGTATSTNYYLRWKGVFSVVGGGVVNIGTSGTRIPASSTVTLEMDCATSLDSYVSVGTGGTWNTYGAVKTPYTKLTVDAASSATSITVGSTSGWQTGDTLMFTPTGNNSGHHETKTISTVDSGTAVTLSAGLTNAHSGTGDLAGYVANLTRNVIVKSVSTTNRGNFRAQAAGTVYVEYAFFNASSLGNGAGSGTASCVDLATTTGSATFKGCSVVGNGEGHAYMFYAWQSASNNFTWEDCVTYNWGQRAYVVEATTGTNWVIRNCMAIGFGSIGFYLLDGSGTLDGLIAMVGGTGIHLGFANNSEDQRANPYQDLEAAYCSTGCHTSDEGTHLPNRLRLDNLKFWHNSSGLTMGSVSHTTINGIKCFGNTSQGLLLGLCRYLEINSGTLGGSSVSGQAQPHGIHLNPGSTPTWIAKVHLNSSTFSVATGAYTAHATGDVSLGGNARNWSTLQVLANNCTFAATTPFNELTYVNQQLQGDHLDNAGSWIRVQRWSQTNGVHQTHVPQGVIRTDTNIYHTAAPAERLTPNSATYKLRSSPARTAIESGNDTTVRVWVRKSASGDGAAYNGNQPRLILRRNDALGVTSDQVLDTMTASTGNWEQLEGTTPTASDDGVFELYVDCDGTAGWINIDDWS